MTNGNPCFVDTNILLTATDTDRAHHSAAAGFLEKGLGGRERLFASGQVFREYLVVATRPTNENGLGLSPEDALRNIDAFRRCIQMLDETDASARRLETLVDQHQLRGKRIHDANIVAVMVENGLQRLCTLNPDDFQPFPGLHLELF